MWWHTRRPDFVFRAKRTSPFKPAGASVRLLTAEVCTSALVMLDTPCSEVVWRVLATHSIHQFPLHFPSGASPCAITSQLDSNSECITSQYRIIRRVSRGKDLEGGIRESVCSVTLIFAWHGWGNHQSLVWKSHCRGPRFKSVTFVYKPEVMPFLANLLGVTLSAAHTKLVDWL